MSEFKENSTLMDPDFFRAYGLVLNTFQTTSHTFEHLENTKRTFPIVLEAIASDRQPYTIMKIASKVGMYIPPRKRIGIKAYEFFINNITYYEEVLDRSAPSIYEIILARNSLDFLMKFKDNQILQQGCKFSRNYTDRKEMLVKFIQDNILPYGNFMLDIHSRKVYNSKVRLIVYSDKNSKIHYSVEELLARIDIQNGKIWKNATECFTSVSLLHLRQQILEKLGQWRQRDGHLQNFVAPALNKLLSQLESILHYEPKNEISAYLGHPVFA